ncbi:MAG: GDP-L-fucose synthase [bacterium]|nr:GDP-L-fucose synthase [bacterium]
MKKNSKIFVAGHQGLVGSNITKKLQQQGYTNLILKTFSELNLMDFEATKKFFETEKPEYTFLAAAKVGGILANKDFGGDFIYNNLSIEINVIKSAQLAKVTKLLFLGSSCIYPRDCPQPIKEEYLMTGPLEETNKPYAVAKIAGIVMCQAFNKQYGTNFISVMPTNLYGPDDNFDLKNSHVLPALIRKMHEAKESNSPTVEIWGTGTPKREFLFVEDLADACVYLMNNYDDPSIINIGVGQDLTIKELAQTIKEIVGFKGQLEFDTSKPDGTPRKLLDVSKLNSTGWKAKTDLKDGIQFSYTWFVEHWKDK